MSAGAVTVAVLAVPFAGGCTGDLFHDTVWADNICPPDASPHDEACVVEVVPGVFVRNEGSDDAAGTRHAPVATLARAIELAASSSKRVYACAQTFEEAVALPSGVALFGGLDCDDGWKWVGGDRRTVIGPPSIPAASGDSIAITMLPGSAVTRIEDVDAHAGDGVSPGASSIAVYADHTTGVIQRSKLTAGAGAAGATPETPSMPGAAGVPGKGGASACLGDSDVSAGGVGPELACDGITTRGGDGGNGDLSTKAGDGQDGLPAGTGGDGGWGGSFMDPACANGEDGADGEPGAAGAGAGAEDNGLFTAERFVGAAGQPGAPGKPGQGGGGGGASTVAGCTSGAGAAGGSGGTGGCGGKPGGGGGAGGSSIAVASNGAALTIHASELEAKQGGPGGNGGASFIGGLGANGGAGGNGVGTVPPGCNGGRGGNGGPGGPGGGGRGGHSIGIAFAGAPVTEADLTFSVDEPGPGGNVDDTISAGATGLAVETHDFSVEVPTE